MKKVYNKLVRDRIPEIIQAAGRECAIEILSELDYQQALQQKLIEEAQEAATADPTSTLIQELADLYEVIDTLMTVHQIDRSTILQVQAKRRSERGGLDQRIFLHWVEADALDQDFSIGIDDRAEESQNKK